MTDHQPDYEQVQDQTDDGLRRAPRTYQRSPRGPMKGRPVIVAIMPGIPKPVLETAVEYAMAMNSKLVFTHVATDRVPSPSNPDASHPLDPTAQRTSMETVKSAIHSALDAFMSDYPKADWSWCICPDCQISSWRTWLTPLVLDVSSSVPVGQGSGPAFRNGWMVRSRCSWDVVSCVRSSSCLFGARIGSTHSASEFTGRGLRLMFKRGTATSYGCNKFSGGYSSGCRVLLCR